MSRPKLTGRMPSVCMTCGDTYAFKPCLPEQDGLPSHGYCPPCFEQEKRHLDAFFATFPPAGWAQQRLPLNQNTASASTLAPAAGGILSSPSFNDENPRAIAPPGGA